MLGNSRDLQRKLLNTKQASIILGISSKTLWLKAKNGEIPSVQMLQKGRRVYRFDPQLIYELKKQNEKGSSQVLKSKGGEFLFQPWISKDNSVIGRVMKIEKFPKDNYLTWVHTSYSVEEVEELKQQGWKPLIIVNESRTKTNSNGTVTLCYPVPNSIHDPLYDHLVFLFFKSGSK